MPREMTAVEIVSPGGPEVLRPTRRPVPTPREGEVLIRVEAAGINRPDILQRLGRYAPPEGVSDIPGLEVSGTIVECGPGTAALPGERVCALLAGGGYAEYATAPYVQCLPVPSGFAAREAAAIPETFFTVWDNVFTRGKLRAGERLLVHGGSSGIGTTAIQLGRAFGATVFATAGTREKCRACEELGATRAILYKEEDFVSVVREETGGTGVDVVLDMVGASYLSRNVEVLGLEGRLVLIATLEGDAGAMPLGALLRKRLTLMGSTLRPRSAAEKGAVAQSLRSSVWPLLEKGDVRPVLYKAFPLAEASAAHALMESGAHIGKIVLDVEEHSLPEPRHLG